MIIDTDDCVYLCPNHNFDLGLFLFSDKIQTKVRAAKKDAVNLIHRLNLPSSTVLFHHNEYFC